MIQLEDERGVRAVQAVHYRTELEVGEGPRWDAVAGLWTWIDIATGSYFEQGAEGPVAQFRAPLGCTVRHEDGSVLGACPDGLYRWDRTTPPQRVRTLPIEVRQLNDGRCDRAGRWWIGAVDESYSNGSLLRVDVDGTVSVMAGGYQLPNGIDWLHDGRTMLHADSYARIIYAYDFDERAGGVTRRRTWWSGIPEDGLPDGLTVAHDGTVWVAFWGGEVVRQFDPDGALLAVLRMPVRQPSSVALGGPDGEEMFVTSAWSGLASADARPDSSDGDCFLLHGIARSRGENLCRVDLTNSGGAR